MNSKSNYNELIEKLKKSLDENVDLNENEAKLMYCCKVLDPVRKLISDRHVPILKRWINSEKPFIRVLAWNCLRENMDESLYTLLKHCFEQENDPEAKTSLIFQLTHKELPLDEFEKYLKVLDTIPESNFKNIVYKYYGGLQSTQDAFLKNKERFHDPNYSSKRILYAYMACRLGYPDAKAYLAIAKNFKDIDYIFEKYLKKYV